MSSNITTLNRKKGNIKAQITKLSNWKETNDPSDIAAHLTVLEKLQKKFDDLKTEYFESATDEEILEIEISLAEMDSDIQDLEIFSQRSEPPEQKKWIFISTRATTSIKTLKRKGKETNSDHSREKPIETSLTQNDKRNYILKKNSIWTWTRIRIQMDSLEMKPTTDKKLRRPFFRRFSRK
ncbi:hypothetical protein NPIL_80811 [Nephila pilipes]|uniref:Uncharacterized protein n=1 Tax=Nephila pilipes TaxID=299642 RepID=A0A8X6MCZ6_NEPPI|nr:hypothetical protein NPIL_80811 [Nephila pilipes]